MIRCKVTLATLEAWLVWKQGTYLVARGCWWTGRRIRQVFPNLFPNFEYDRFLVFPNLFPNFEYDRSLVFHNLFPKQNYILKTGLLTILQWNTTSPFFNQYFLRPDQSKPNLFSIDPQQDRNIFNFDDIRECCGPVQRIKAQIPVHNSN